MKLTDVDLLYSATGRCRCGAGLAYPLDHEDALKLRAWVCSDGLKEGRWQDGSIDPDHDSFPFAFHKIREETSINGNGDTTRPPGTVARTVGSAICPSCGHEWRSEPYVACGLGHHWFSGPCPGCGYSTDSAGTWKSGDGEPIKTRYHTVVLKAGDEVGP